MYFTKKYKSGTKNTKYSGLYCRINEFLSIMKKIMKRCETREFRGEYVGT